MESQSRSWFAILSFCATVVTVAAFGLAILVASATVAFEVAHRLESGSSNDGMVIKAEASLPAAQVQSRVNTAVNSITTAKTRYPRRQR